MTKREAAEALGVSLRAIHRYVTAGKLSVDYQRNAQGSMIAIYKESEVEALKDEFKRPTVGQVKTARKKKGPLKGSRGSQALTTRDAGSGVMALLTRLAEDTGARPVLPLESKLMLTLDDAVLFCSVSRDYLMNAIRKGKLKAARRGRRWIIKRSDLDAWVKKD